MRLRITRTFALFLIAVMAQANSGSIFASEQIEFFEKKIRPILATHCYECHGTEKAESDLRLDHISFLQREGVYGKVLVPGKPDESSLFISLTHQDEDLKMPFERDQLDKSTIADFNQWIKQGAVWPEEDAPVAKAELFDLAARKERLAWIWQTPEKQVTPGVKNTDWPTSNIDRFVLARLEKEALQPAVEAEPEVWLRRVYFAITGLPPTPEEIQTFLVDTSAQQREALVDRLLESPHYGERWARHWMDLVRYSESRGHESDFIIANAWHYRDYLIRAFNDDLPYNQFVREHLAGDLLDSPRINPQTGWNESTFATAWPFFGEEVHSPVDIRQDECDRVDNKIDVLSKTFLGLTVACARCHDHKFDAISQADYYSLAGFVLSSRFRQVRFETQAHNREIAKQIDTLYAETQQALVKVIGLDEIRQDGPSESIQSDAEHRVIVDYSDSEWQGQFVGLSFGQVSSRVGDFVIPSAADEPVSQVLLRGVAQRDPIWNGLRLADGNEKDSGSLDAVGRSAGFLTTPTFMLDDTDGGGRVHILMQGESQVYAAVASHLMITGPLHGRLIAKLKSPEPKWVSIDLTEYRGHRVHLEFGPMGDAPLSIWKVVEAKEPPTDIGLLTKDVSVERSDDANQQIQSIVAAYHSKRADLAKAIQTTSRTAITLVDGTAVDEHVLIRGQYSRPGEIAPRKLPSALESEPIESSGSGRLSLAEQLIDPANPLVARVIVNRIWHHLIGRGIVASVDNFGYLGQRPTHPELLDHLAYQFVHEDEWSIKRTIKRIVLSRTFSMTSRPDDAKAEQLDPDNLLLHRMPIRRLESEAIRDNLLAVSGRLDRTISGKPVPVHLTEFVIGRGRPGTSGPLDGAGRRSIYTSVRRNFLPTMMLTFDMPIPFSTVGRRNVTNVPGQSLALMNDKLVYEQAFVWAKRIRAEMPKASAKERIERMYWEAVGRQVNEEETVAALETIALLAGYHATSEDDEKVWTDLCHTMFRLNEFIYLR